MICKTFLVFWPYPRTKDSLVRPTKQIHGLLRVGFLENAGGFHGFMIISLQTCFETERMYLVRIPSVFDSDIQISAERGAETFRMYVPIGDNLPSRSNRKVSSGVSSGLCDMQGNMHLTSTLAPRPRGLPICTSMHSSFRKSSAVNVTKRSTSPWSFTRRDVVSPLISLCS